MPAIDEVVTSNECISEDIPTSEVRQEPYSLPDGFKWDTLQLDDPLVLKEVYVLLNENYVEDDDNMFRFDYRFVRGNWYNACDNMILVLSLLDGLFSLQDGSKSGIVVFVWQNPTSWLALFQQCRPILECTININTWWKSTFYVCIRS